MSESTEIAAQQIRGRHPYAFRSGEWTDWRETPAVQAGRDKAALRRILDELEGFLTDAPADAPEVMSLRQDIERCRRFLSQGTPINLSKGLRA